MIILEIIISILILLLLNQHFKINLCTSMILIYTLFFSINILKEGYADLHNGYSNVFMDIKFNNNVRRLIFELYDKETPIAVSNFKLLITGKQGYTNNGMSLSYAHTKFYKVIPNKLMSGGNILNNSDSDDIYGYRQQYINELKGLNKKNTIGTLVIENTNHFKNNNLNFSINLGNNSEYDGTKVVIGSLRSGFDIISLINKGKIKDITIVNCGVLYQI